MKLLICVPFLLMVFCLCVVIAVAEAGSDAKPRPKPKPRGACSIQEVGKLLLRPSKLLKFLE